MLKELPTDVKEKVKRLIASTKGKFFRVIVTKRTNGELRTMDCRIGVKAFTNGGGPKYNPDEHDLVWVWDLRAWNPETGDTGYRSINLRTVKEIHFAGEVHKFE